MNALQGKLISEPDDLVLSGWNVLEHTRLFPNVSIHVSLLGPML